MCSSLHVISLPPLGAINLHSGVEKGLIPMFLILLNPNLSSEMDENDVKSCTDVLKMLQFRGKWYHTGTIFAQIYYLSYEKLDKKRFLRENSD